MERCQRNTKSTCGGLYIDSSDDERKGDAPFSDHARNFLPIEVPNTIAMRRKMDTFGVDKSLKGSSGKDTIIDQTAESPGEAYWKSQIRKGQFSLYRSGVGMLLYLVKHSRPDIANCVRVSKVLDGTTDCAFNEMLRIIKYVLDTKHLGLKIEPDDKPPGSPWQITYFSDSNYANDPETRRSVSGYIVYMYMEYL